MSEPFDFDAFIRGAEMPHATVPLIRKDRSAQITELRAALDRLPEEGDERETTVDERAPLLERIAALEAEQAESAMIVELRALNPQEFKDVVLDEAKDVYDQIAAQSRGTRNEGDRERWESVAAKVTAHQWGAFVERANALVLTKVTMPDFSQNGSTTPTRRPSSASSAPAVSTG
jgi:hypothetical protein